MTRSSHSSQAWSAGTGSEPGTSRYLRPVLLDSVLGFAPEGGPGSVLTLPLGMGLLVDELTAALAGVSTGRTLVVAAPGIAYNWGGRCAALQVVQPETLEQELSGCEAGDYLLLVEPRHWPLAGYDFEAIVGQSRQTTGATYAVAVGRDEAQASERVECDPQGRVRRVQRVYSPAGWSGQAAGTVVCAVVPARALVGARFESLGDLRGQLAGRGVLTRDIVVRSGLADVSEPAGVLTLAERAIDAAMHGSPPAGLTAVRPMVLAGDNCRIAPSARLVGPIVLQGDVVVEPEATLVGPVLVGRGATIGSRALVARSVVLPDSRIAEGISLCNEIVSGLRTSESAGADRTVNHQAVQALDSCLSRHLVVADLPRKGRSPRRRVELAIKRGLDLALAGLGLIVLSPLLVATGFLVKITSPGPVFFIHRREGQDGREFGCIKFRSMEAGAHRKQREMYGQNQVDGPQFKMTNDPRVTPLGQFLRKTNIDELPQLLNVMAGHMSLVGPRPSPFRENQICVAWRRARLSVRPGITGVWQICRDRANDEDFHQWIFYDLAYVKHVSLWLDARILFWTVASGGGRRRVAMERLINDGGPETEDGNGSAESQGAATAVNSHGDSNGSHRWTAKDAD